MPAAKCSRTPAGIRNFAFLRPSVEPLRRADLLFAERLTVCGVRVLLGRRPVANMAVHYDERGPARWSS
jgi:hypothetical protein